MTGTTCAAFGCNNAYAKSKGKWKIFTLHRFPKDKAIRKGWIDACRRSDKFNPDASRLCSLHFTEDDYERDLQNELLGLPLRIILKKTAVPTQALYWESKSREVMSPSIVMQKIKVVSAGLLPRCLHALHNVTKMALTEVSANKSFGGWQKVFSHESKELGCTMKFGVYLPPQAEEKKVPVIYWLSGLTCSEANFIEKAGAQRYAAQHGVIVVNPDTSPRDLNIPGDSESWDFGVGAGFYVNATQEPWKKNYRMYEYVTSELIDLVNSNFNVAEGKQSIMGHSMGGHGALIIALKNPGLFKSVSAFAPICNPTVCPWGIKAFTGYLGPKESGNWDQWDATELAKKYNGPPLEVLIDQGTADQFLFQLNPQNLVEACKGSKVSAVLKQREGYNHSYFYIASFIGEHFEFHSKL